MKLLLLFLMILGSFAHADDRPVIEKFAREKTDKLVILLHAVQTSAKFINLYYPLRNYVDDYGFNLVIPSGQKNRKGERYWSAGKACCDFYQDGGDDVKYLDALIDHYKEKLGAKEIYLAGHSNGAFLAQYYACHGKHDLRGIFSFAGNPDSDLKDCKKQRNFTALLAHGHTDTFVPYDGGELKNGGHHSIPVSSYLASYQGALGCSELQLDEEKNFTLNRLGKDTRVHKANGCTDNNQLIFWEYSGGHVPRFHGRYFRSILKTLLAH